MTFCQISCCLLPFCGSSRGFPATVALLRKPNLRIDATPGRTIAPPKEDAVVESISAFKFYETLNRIILLVVVGTKTNDVAAYHRRTLNVKMSYYMSSTVDFVSSLGKVFWLRMTSIRQKMRSIINRL